MYVVTNETLSEVDKVMHFKQMFVTAVCVLFLLKLKWPKSKTFYETNIDFIHFFVGLFPDTWPNKIVKKTEKLEGALEQWVSRYVMALISPPSLEFENQTYKCNLELDPTRTNSRANSIVRPDDVNNFVQKRGLVVNV